MLYALNGDWTKMTNDQIQIIIQAKPPKTRKINIKMQIIASTHHGKDR